MEPKAVVEGRDLVWIPRSLTGECDGAVLHDILADIERNPRLRDDGVLQ
jgi:hypothetical protein